MKRIENAKMLYMDVGPVSRLLEFHADYYPVVSAVLDRVYERNIQMVTSPITLYSVCLRAFSSGDTTLARQYREFFTRSAHVSLREIDADIALAAAEFRARHGISFEESFQLATAFHCGADVVVTDKDSWRGYLDSAVITLEELREQVSGL